jgi:hypothetical protein
MAGAYIVSEHYRYYVYHLARQSDTSLHQARYPVSSGDCQLYPSEHTERTHLLDPSMTSANPIYTLRTQT